MSDEDEESDEAEEINIEEGSGKEEQESDKEEENGEKQHNDYNSTTKCSFFSSFFGYTANNRKRSNPDDNTPIDYQWQEERKSSMNYYYNSICIRVWRCA